MHKYDYNASARQKAVKLVKKQKAQFFDLEEGRFFLWLPVFLAIGIGLYFGQPTEPASSHVASLFFGGLLVTVLLRHYSSWLITPTIVMSLICGFALAKLRSEMVRSPVLEKTRGFYQVEGQIERLTRLPGEEKRLQLTRLVIAGIEPGKTPYRIRVTSRIKDAPLIVGSRVKLRAVLRPPPGPVRPGGFDFARQAWF